MIAIGAWLLFVIGATVLGGAAVNQLRVPRVCVP